MIFSNVGWSDDLCNNSEANLDFIALQESPAGERARAFLRLYWDRETPWNDPELFRIGAPLFYALYRFSQQGSSGDEKQQLIEYADEAVALASKNPELQPA